MGAVLRGGISCGDSALHVCCRYLTGLPRLFCQQFEFALQKGLEQAPRSSAYFRNPPVLSGQAWYCSFLWAVEGSLQ